MRQRLGKRPHSPERRRSVSPVISRNAVSRREPLTDVRSRLGVAKLESRGLYSESPKDKKTGKVGFNALLVLFTFFFFFLILVVIVFIQEACGAVSARLIRTTKKTTRLLPERLPQEE